MSGLLKITGFVGALLLALPFAKAARPPDDITSSIRMREVSGNAEKDNACASLMGHAQGRVYGDRMGEWADRCSGNTTAGGIICSETKKALIEAGGRHANLAGRISCPSGF